jgi:CDP-glycerol glycerophosphotransferase (TagB/SpsB family)
MIKYLIFTLTIPSPAYAYLDPGSGSLILYFIIGVFATIVYYFKKIFYKVRELFIKDSYKKKLKNLDEVDLLFYSEGGQYWNVFKPIIDELEKKKVRSVYYTNKENDPALRSDYKYLQKEYIGDDTASFLILNNLKVKLFITTTPQLNVMQLKKSKYVQEYVHIVHSPIDCLFYRYFAFDFFDTIMCSGKHQIESIRELEDIRKTKKKELLQTGLTYLDILKSSKDKLELNNTKKYKKVILVAPTWKKDNLLEKYGVKFLTKLISLNYEVILRPHPQMYISKLKIIESFEQEIQKYSEIKIDKSLSAEESMTRADLLISDLSGVIFDFNFVFEKPVIAINSKIPKFGQEAEFVSREPWEIINLEKVAKVLKDEDIENIDKHINEALEKNLKNDVKNFREASLFNYGYAGRVAAEQILKKINI